MSSVNGNADPCENCTIAGIFGGVNFSIDTAHFTGVRSLSAGDVALFYSPYDAPFTLSYSFPTTYQWYDAPYDTYGLASSLTGDFRFIDGKIVDWNLQGTLNLVGCGAGPGCSFNGSLSVARRGDAFSQGDYAAGYHGLNDKAGIWTQQPLAPGVPELPTWAMLLVAFSGLSFFRFDSVKGARLTAGASVS